MFIQSEPGTIGLKVEDDTRENYLLNSERTNWDY